ncbi:MAG: glutamine-hydrolyzing carbamoyl-phosphate synthase small subunit [Clostridia bacterium]|nr:glutamine-hydrolyzing carbamoyl-phosphate synthase small subunit [Clostridia bacterium]
MAYLVLGNGSVFEGKRIGYRAPETVGELVFTTGMVGYLETLTDPSYAGQIVVQTFPLIGNYGLIPEDFEGECALSGYVVRELCDTPSNFRSQGPLEQWLTDHRIPGIAGVDTREITRQIREQGVMNAMICESVPEDRSAINGFAVRDVLRKVTCREPKVYPAEGTMRYAVTLIDYGAKRNIIRSLQQRGCQVTVVPAFTPAEEILAGNPDGVMLSNGPGDPAENTGCIREIAHLIGQVPVFGICLGHQMAALAMGGKTIKLKYGHRGGNQPATDRETGRTYMTSQNHGYAVVAGSLGETGIETFVNANDGSCEGMRYPGKRCFTVQFHPEAHGGPQDTSFLFDRFISMMGGK